MGETLRVYKPLSGVHEVEEAFLADEEDQESEEDQASDEDNQDHFSFSSLNKRLAADFRVA